MLCSTSSSFYVTQSKINKVLQTDFIYILKDFKQKRVVVSGGNRSEANVS